MAQLFVAQGWESRDRSRSPRGMGAKGKKGGSSKGQGAFIATQKEITAAGKDQQTLLDLLNNFHASNRPLNAINLATIFFRAAKSRAQLPPHIITYITEKLHGEDAQEFGHQAVGNAVYGLQCMGDSPEVKDLLKVLIIKVQTCSDELTGQEIGNALYGLQRLSDSEEVLQLVAALTTKVQESRQLCL